MHIPVKVICSPLNAKLTSLMINTIKLSKRMALLPPELVPQYLDTGQHHNRRYLFRYCDLIASASGVGRSLKVHVLGT